MSELRDAISRIIFRAVKLEVSASGAADGVLAEVARVLTGKNEQPEPKVTYHYFMSKSGEQGGDGYRHAPYASVCLPVDAVVTEATFGVDGTLHLKAHRER